MLRCHSSTCARYASNQFRCLRVGRRFLRRSRRRTLGHEADWGTAARLVLGLLAQADMPESLLLLLQERRQSCCCYTEQWVAACAPIKLSVTLESVSSIFAEIFSPHTQTPKLVGSHIAPRLDEWHRKHGQLVHTLTRRIQPLPAYTRDSTHQYGNRFICGGKHGEAKHMQFDLPGKRLPGSVPARNEAFRSVAAVCYGIIRDHPLLLQFVPSMSRMASTSPTLTKRM